MPSRLGNAFSAASFVSTTRCPRAPLGARSLGTSTSVRHPSNGRRLGCPLTSGNSPAIAATAKPRDLHRRASISLNHSSWLLFLCSLLTTLAQAPVTLADHASSSPPQSSAHPPSATPAESAPPSTRHDSPARST